MVNKNTVLAFLLGSVIAFAISQWLHSPQSSTLASLPAASMATANSATAHPLTQPSMPAAVMPMGDAKAGSIDTLTDRLKARLEKEPNDVNGWVLLARSYHYLQRWDEAKAAFAKAKSLGYQGAEDQASVSADAGADAGAGVGANSGAVDPVFESVARAAQQQAAQLQMPAVGAGK